MSWRDSGLYTENTDMGSSTYDADNYALGQALGAAGADASELNAQ